jgi:hypothetical protein
LASVYWGLGQIPKQIDDLGKCFADPGYAVFADRWKRQFFSNAGMASCGIVLLAIGAFVAYLGMFDSFPRRLEDTMRPVRHVLPSPWYQGDLISHYVLVLIIGVFVCVAGGSGVWLFLVNLPFLNALSKLRIVPLPGVLLRKFRPMSDFYVVSTLAWFVGVGLEAVIFFPNLSSVAIVFLLVTSFIGLTAFVLPQIVFHNLIMSAHGQIADMRIDYFNSMNAGVPLRSASELARIDEASHPQALWVFDNNDLFSLLFTYFIQLLPLVLGSRIGFLR